MVNTLREAMALHEARDLVAAERAYRRIVGAVPTTAEAWHRLSILLAESGRFDEALACVQRACGLAAADYRYAYTLAQIWRALGKAAEAAQEFARTLALEPDFLDARVGLAVTLHEMEQIEAAQAQYEAILAHLPQHALALNNLALIAQVSGDHERAEALLERLTRLAPDLAAAWNNRGNSLKHLHRRREAVDSFTRALQVAPDYREAAFNLGKTCLEAGDCNQARAAFARAAGMADQADTMPPPPPQDPDARKTALDAHRAWLSCFLYQPIDLDAYYAVHEAFGRRWSSPPQPVMPSANRPAGPLRIAYVSSDFWNHPVARNLQPLIEAHDRSQFEVCLYFTGTRCDAMTEYLQRQATLYREIAHLSDADAAKQMRADGIHIAVFLAGHFDENRPTIAAHRAAPVQVAFHDPATSGISAMDYLLTDRYLSPRATRERFTERLIRLPRYYVHAPLEQNAEPVSSPLPRQQIVFGSFNNPAKLSNLTLELWARVLQGVPNSQLVLKYHDAYADSMIRERICVILAQHGIDAARIAFPARGQTISEHLSQYHAIDVALDTYPFTGSTTTFEALWMGVPVVTLAGESMVSRWSYALLCHLGLADWAAFSPEDFVARAVHWANDPPDRAALRERVQSSHLCKGGGYTRHIERAYRYMWARHLHSVQTA